MALATFVLIVVPGLAIAAWLAFLFVRKRQYEKGVTVFLSITLTPLLAWYFTTWLRDDSPLWQLFETLPGGLWDLLPGLVMVGVFAWLCIFWARKGQSVEERPTTTITSQGVADPASVQAPAEPPTDGSARARLESLEELRRAGLISDEEYAAKRSEILSSI